MNNGRNKIGLFLPLLALTSDLDLEKPIQVENPLLSPNFKEKKGKSKEFLNNGCSYYEIEGQLIYAKDRENAERKYKNSLKPKTYRKR